jgi:hypothetical protein
VPQAYGARSFKALGVVLQRALLITWLTCLPITLLWTHSRQLLLALGQHPAVAAGASMYLTLITPALYAGALVECLKRYLLAQRVVVPGMCVTAVTALLSPLYNWALMFRCVRACVRARTSVCLGKGGPSRCCWHTRSPSTRSGMPCHVPQPAASLPSLLTCAAAAASLDVLQAGHGPGGCGHRLHAQPSHQRAAAAVLHRVPRRMQGCCAR